MAEEKKQEEIRVNFICPDCDKPIGEGECQRCANFRFAVKENGGYMVMM